MRWTLIALVLLAASVEARVGTAWVYVDGQELVNACLDTSSASQTRCLAFVEAAADAATVNPPAGMLICPPTGLLSGGLRDNFLAWAASKPDELDRVAITLVIESMRARWPCPMSAS